MNQDKKIDNPFKSVDKFAWIILLFIWGLYAYLSFQTPSGQALMKYHLSLYQLSLLRFSIILPVLFIWSAILYGSLKLYVYSQTIITNKDGKGFRFIAHGVFLFLLSSVVSSYVSLWRQFHPKDLEFIKNLSIFNNYLMVFFALVSFSLIWLGSKKFLEMVHVGKKAKQQSIIVWAAIIALSIPYIYFVTQNPLRSTSSIQDVSSTYNLPDFLIFSTIVTPYIISWLLGLLAVMNMAIFSQETKGIFYKKALNKFNKGFWMIIILAIALQYLTQFTLFFSQATIAIILLIIYVILLVDGVGFVFMAYGAKQLAKIESV